MLSLKAYEAETDHNTKKGIQNYYATKLFIFLCAVLFEVTWFFLKDVAFLNSSYLDLKRFGEKHT